MDRIDFSHTVRHSVIACFCLLSACAIPRVPALSSENISHTLLSRRLDDTGLHRFIDANLERPIKTWPVKTWNFQLLTLAALYYHPDLDIAKAQWATAKAAIITAGGSPNPTFGFTPERITNPGGISPWINSFTFDVPIETAGKRRYRIEQANALARSAQKNVATIAWQIRNRLQTALLNLSVARQKQAVLSLQHTLLRDYSELLGERVTLGMISPLNVTDYRLFLDQTGVTLAETRAAIHQSEADVAQAIGIPLSALQRISISLEGFANLPSLSAKTLNAVRERALTNRSDILSGLDDYAAAVGALNVELAKRVPDVNLGPGYQWSQGEHHWSLGFTVTLPIFNQNKGPIAETRSKCEESASKFEALQALIIANLDHAWVGYRDNMTTLAAANLMIVNQKKKLTSLESVLNPSETIRSSLVTARLGYNAAALARVDAFGNALKSLIALEDVMQGPLQNPHHAVTVTSGTLVNSRYDEKKGRGK